MRMMDCAKTPAATTTLLLRWMSADHRTMSDGPKGEAGGGR